MGPSRGRVLVVEDNELNLKLVQHILRLSGYTTTAARSGEEAIRTAVAGKFDLVLMDIQLPGMDGLEVTRRIKEDPGCRDLPVVAVSALARPEDRARAAASGCVAYVEKPYGRASLLETLERVLAPAAAAATAASG